MSKAIAMAGGTGLISREDLASSLNNAAMSMPSVGNGNEFLKMDKGNGDWVFGQEETVVEEGSLWAINPSSLKHGFVAWDTDAGGAPIEEMMVPVSRPLPAESALPELPVSTKSGRALKYQQQRSVELVCISGEDEGTVCEYKQSSVGAMKLFSSITNSLLSQLSKDPENIVAVVTLGSDRYKHKTYGWIYNPEWPITEWRSMDDVSEPEAAEAPEEAEEKPKATRRTKKADTPSEADADEAAAAEYAEAEQAEAAAPRRRQRR